MPTRSESRAAFAPTPRPRTLLLGLAGWLLVVLAVSSLAAPPLYWLVEALAPGEVPFARLFRRVALLAAVAYLVVWCRRLGVRGAAGLGLDARGWRGADARRGVAIGALVATGLLMVELALGQRLPHFEIGWLGVGRALVAGAAVGLLEEAICRGALVFPFGRLAGLARLAAAAAVSALYATAHFARGGRSRWADVGWESGLELWTALPGTIAGSLEAWSGLFAVGLLLDRLVRLHGHAWGAVGFHAGAVAAIQLGAGWSEPAAPGSTLFFTDGLLPGWGVAAVAGGLLLALEAVRATRGRLATDRRLPA